MSTASVSVIIPSRLAKAPDGERWAAKAVRSVRAQTEKSQGAVVMLAVDHGATVSAVDIPDVDIVTYGPLGRPGHVSAMNAAVQKTTGELLAFLEDDDVWHPKRLAYGLQLITDNQADFVSCSQLEVDFIAGPGPVNDFPTCSGWLLRRRLWEDAMGADERFRIHWDNDFLGRINKLPGVKRIHLVEKNADRRRPWLSNVAKYSRLMETHEEEPLVRRIVHQDSIMGVVGQNKARQLRSAQEYGALEVIHGCVPW